MPTLILVRSALAAKIRSDSHARGVHSYPMTSPLSSSNRARLESKNESIGRLQVRVSLSRHEEFDILESLEKKAEKTEY